MTGFGKIFIVIGVVFILIGLLWTFIGKLPGDISFKKGNFSFHFPIMTSIVVSVILTLIFYIIGRFK
ncbi:hypothetical protein J416_07432 [Gracilibacillus halophilus YIM-C55.5]|uniref:DUF2905 domain-containing protein n=1 Tax=Gracilibacillus halophilus YIM-C55.5 TaxID=1308866 RepID=N4WLT1_9BACI|nr:DUF2905 domain-containing protein [Gracilibacillus halophilus]ENH97102.1 hypothetical protein J416_07432 [Gracilibacillus halophilus YIM-C55.5]